MRILNMIRHVRNWPAYLAFKYLSSRQKPFTFVTAKAKITVPPRMMHTFKESFFDSLYLEHLPKSVLEMPQPVVIDVGANVGYFSLFALNTLNQPRIWSYEPMPMNYQLLRTYVEETGDANWITENKAVSGSPGTLTLHYNSNDSFTTSATIFDKAGETDSVTVECLTLEILMKQNQLSRIDILKLDCEGSEYEILYKASDEVLNRISSLTIETHPGKGAQENKIALTTFLAQKGFQTYTDASDLLWAWRR